MGQSPEAGPSTYRRARAAYLRRLSKMTHMPGVASALLDIALALEAEPPRDAATPALAASTSGAR